ncbi:hypothetical protein G4B88_027240 [Cannabis sativa]|uniref:Chalcone/stilbene synthase C-terminal domain-containing protein n=1 Tax=Cannabis sativa TaxID=3483 RepID=A0A7J6HT26_CANSA|nr:hypothetical protein G4B88_027240 [Cannabis sativa]
MDSLEPKYSTANALANSVLPTPVGPVNKKLAIGRLGSLIPARARRMARLMASTASSCPIIRLCSVFSMLSNLFDSEGDRFSNGIPVQDEINKPFNIWIVSSTDGSVIETPYFGLYTQTGGRAILDEIEAKLELEKEKMVDSRHVLSEYGNMSSPCVLFVMDKFEEKNV